MKKKLPCSYDACKHRRRHWCSPDVERGVQYVEVDDSYTGPVYCSLTCALMAGAISLRPDKKEKE
jgi:hypothetical protein